MFRSRGLLWIPHPKLQRPPPSPPVPAPDSWAFERQVFILKSIESQCITVSATYTIPNRLSSKYGKVGLQATTGCTISRTVTDLGAATMQTSLTVTSRCPRFVWKFSYFNEAGRCEFSVGRGVAGASEEVSGAKRLIEAVASRGKCVGPRRGPWSGTMVRNALQF